MANPVSYWKAQITETFISNLQSIGVTNMSRSAVSLWGLFAYAFAYCAWVLDVLFDLHKKEVEYELSLMPTHKISWYVNKVLDFQYGCSLIPETDQFDNSNLSDTQIEASKIIKYCTIIQADTIRNRLIIKVAKDHNGNIDQLSPEEISALQYYCNQFKDAGMFIRIISYQPDLIFFNLRIYYDPLLLTSSGFPITANGVFVEAAIRAYLKSLHGEFRIADFIDYLQKIPGVVIPHVDSIKTSWLNPEIGDYDNPKPVDVFAIAFSGFFVTPDFSGIKYIPYQEHITYY